MWKSLVADLPCVFAGVEVTTPCWRPVDNFGPECTALGGGLRTEVIPGITMHGLLQWIVVGHRSRCSCRVVRSRALQRLALLPLSTFIRNLGLSEKPQIADTS